MFKNKNIEKLNTHLNTLISFFLVLISLLSHTFTFIQITNNNNIFFAEVIFISILFFFALIGFSLNFDFDILLILKIRLIYFLILSIFTDLVLYEIFLSVFLLTIAFYITPFFINIYENKKKFFLPIILNTIIISLIVFYFHKNLILLILFVICNLFHSYFPIISKKMLASFEYSNLPKNLKEYYILEFSKQYVPVTSWIIPFLIVFLFLNFSNYILCIFILSSVFCILYDIYILYIHSLKYFLFTLLFQNIIKLSLMIGLYLVYLMG